MLEERFFAFSFLLIFSDVTNAYTCSGTQPKKFDPHWLDPRDAIEGICPSPPERYTNCNGQPEDDCMDIVSDNTNGVDMILRKEYVGYDDPSWGSCYDAFVSYSP
jgi:hypothetical protein